ncbi:methionine adenosyltransferase [Thiohalocapsa marina]|uniref:Methionine adenosyltransferase n=1 Tax=Thiohalocapsa marina TaxID=424902 RepID=A0A5M8FKT3_9GAMM|nr:methionine adenosyltransferase [Thiohalocapsa marina]KAA6185523.1 methionine adenosyltransferase [Thiohalocapsa marina]
MSDDFIFTSESVTRGHPDKLCDQISDAIVDHCLRQDPGALIIAECAVASGVLFISAHHGSRVGLTITDVARTLIRAVGYPPEVFDADACAIMSSFKDHGARHDRAPDLGGLTDAELDAVTARDQATVFGYACDQTPVLMPLPIWLAHRLARRLDAASLRRELGYLLPDAKTQVGIEYVGGEPKRIHSITLETTQREGHVPSMPRLRQDLIEHAIVPVLAEERLRADDHTHLFINPRGPMVGGGPAAHSGLTGRKTGIDTYGEYARHSGAALSGKDPMRIDRVGAYAARHAAKNAVAAGLARECEVQLSYSIGMAGPVSLRVRSFGTGRIGDDEIGRRLLANFDFRIGAIVRDLRLREGPAEHPDGFYQRLAVYGHMGRADLDPPWERTDRAEALRGD